MGNGNRQASIERQYDALYDVNNNDRSSNGNSNIIQQQYQSNQDGDVDRYNERNINSQDEKHKGIHQYQQGMATGNIHMLFEHQYNTSSTWDDANIVNNNYNSEQFVQCSKQNNQSINQRINNNMQTSPSSTATLTPVSTSINNAANSPITTPPLYYQSSSMIFDLMEKKVKTTGPIHNAKYKIKLCDKYMIDGKCPYKEKCQFAHGQEELMMWAERRRALVIQQNSAFPFSTSPLQQQVTPPTASTMQSTVPLNNMYNGVSSAHLHHNHPYQIAINSDANYYFNQSEMRKTAPYHSYLPAAPATTNSSSSIADQEEKSISNMFTPLSNIGSSSSYQHGQLNSSNDLLSSTISLEADPLIKSIVDLLESGNLGCEDNVLDCKSRERLLSVDISKEASLSSPTLRPSSSNANVNTTRSPFTNPQGNAHEVLSPSKDFSMDDKSESFRSPFRSQNHSMRVNFASFQRGSM